LNQTISVLPHGQLDARPVDLTLALRTRRQCRLITAHRSKGPSPNEWRHPQCPHARQEKATTAAMACMAPSTRGCRLLLPVVMCRQHDERGRSPTPARPARAAIITSDWLAVMTPWRRGRLRLSNEHAQRTNPLIMPNMVKPATPVKRDIAVTTVVGAHRPGTMPPMETGSARC
jgi:hypothetical protein